MRTSRIVAKTGSSVGSDDGGAVDALHVACSRVAVPASVEAWWLLRDVSACSRSDPSTALSSLRPSRGTRRANEKRLGGSSAPTRSAASRPTPAAEDLAAARAMTWTRAVEWIRIAGDGTQTRILAGGREQAVALGPEAPARVIAVLAGDRLDEASPRPGWVPKCPWTLRASAPNSGQRIAHDQRTFVVRRLAERDLGNGGDLVRRRHRRRDLPRSLPAPRQVSLMSHNNSA